MGNLNLKRKDRNSLLVSIYLTSTCISSIISAFITIPLISVLLVSLIMVLVVLNNKHLRILKYDFFYYCILSISIVTSLFFNYGEITLDYLSFFLVFGFSSLVISNIPIDKHKVAIYILIIYFIYFITYFYKIQYIYNDDEANQMGLAYSFAPGVLVGYAILTSRKLYSKKILLLSIFVILCSVMVILFKTVTRGAILSVIVGILFIYYISTDSKNRKRVVISFSLIIPLFIYFIVAAFSSIDTSSVGAIQKLLIMMEGGDVSNGRFDLWENAMNLIIERPLLGYGVGFFEKVNESYYPHQFFLQVLCEFGIIGSIIFLIPLFRKLRNIFRCETCQGTILYSAYFVYSFIQLMFSSSYWITPIFWFLYFNNSLLHSKYKKQ